MTGVARSTVVLAALLLGAGGCAVLDRSEPPEVKPADFVHLSEAATPIVLDDARRIPGDRALLISPHAALKFDSVAVVETIDADHVGLLKLGGNRALRAAAGHEFVVAWLSDDPVEPPYEARDAKVGVAVAVGDREVALPKVPGTLDAVVVSAPKGAPVLLRLSDAERTFTYNLRAGERGADAVPLYYRAKRSGQVNGGEYTGTGRVAYRTDSRTLKVQIRLRELSLQPWLPSAGWAAPDRAWLLLFNMDIRTDGLSVTSAFNVRISLDFAKTFALALPDGNQVRANARKVNVSFTTTESFSVVFDVPADFTTGTLTITPDGTMQAIYRGAEPVISWASAPPPGRFTLALPGA